MTDRKTEIERAGDNGFRLVSTDTWGKRIDLKAMDDFVFRWILANAERGLSAVWTAETLYWDCNILMVRYTIKEHGGWLDEPRHELDTAAITA